MVIVNMINNGNKIIKFIGPSLLYLIIRGVNKIRMDKSGGSIQSAEGMVADGFSSEQQEYSKKMLEIQQNKKEQELEQKAKQEVKCILPPPQQIKSKAYSLLPDKVNGWGFKKQQPNPIPITFGNRYFDNLVNVIMTKPNKKYNMVYLGPRYENTFYAWRDKPFNFPYTHINLPKNIKYKKRPFLGINPQIQQTSVHFDSIFQSGNLDAAIQVDSYQYDLLIRVDSNTRGHFNWFNFTIKNLKVQQKYKFNICNLERGFCLYSRGMKPFIKSLKKKNQDWKQGGQNVTYMKKQIRFVKDYDLQLRKQFTLSFQISTAQLNDEIQIVYCIPYTYSSQINLIENLKLSCQKKNFLKQSSLCMSLGGLPISILTITQPQKNQQNIKQKKCVILCARAHPGQSNGSFMMEGFLKFICGESKHAQTLRKYIVFKIVPMMNPDGVVLGNYRTGLSGKDFNRQYRNPDKDIFPQVYFFKKLVTQIKMTFKNNFFMFLDLHGHSQKKNVFAYGPQFPIANKFYYQSRIFAKILEKQNKVFRYHSCIFKISQCKVSTARAILLKKMNVPLTYTIQASNGFYHDKQLLISIPFTQTQWLKMGSSIGMAIFQYVQSLLLSQKIKQDREKSKFSITKQKNEKEKRKSSSSSPKKDSLSKLISAQQDAKIKRIYQQILKQQNEGVDDPNSDDNISQGSSDKEDDKDDLSKNQLQNLFNSIKYNNKLGKNKQRGNIHKVDLNFQQQDEQKEEIKNGKINQHLKSFRIKRPLENSGEKQFIQNYQTMEQVYIAKQGSLINGMHREVFVSPVYLNHKKKQNSKQFHNKLQNSTRIINYKFEQERKRPQSLETISIFPSFGLKNRSTITISQTGNSPDKIHRAIVISNLCATSRSFKINKNNDLDKTVNFFGIKNHKNVLEKKLQEIGMQKFQQSYTKFTKTNFYNRKIEKNTPISFSKRILDKTYFFD